MKKIFLILLSAFSFQLSAFSGTNAAVVFRTNDYQVAIPNWWPSNATAIANALQGIGFGGAGSGGVTNYFTPQFHTNLAGQVEIISLAVSNLQSVISNANLPAVVATLASNLIPLTLTNAAGQTIEARINAATNTIVVGSFVGTVAATNLPASIATLSSNLIPTTVTNAAGLTLAQQLTAVSNAVLTAVTNSTNAIAAASLTGRVNSNNLPTNLFPTQTNGVMLNATFADASGGVMPNLIVTNLDASSVCIGGDGFGDPYIDMPGLYGTLNFGIGQGGVFPFTVNRTNGNASFGTNNQATIINGLFTGVGSNLTALQASNIVGTIVNTNTMIQSLTASGTNTLTGSWNIPAATIFLQPSTENLVDIGTNSFVVLHLNGAPASFSLTGLVAKSDGREFAAMNDTGQIWTIRNNSGLVITANRINTAQGGDLVLSNNPSIVKFHYSTASNAWIVTEFNAASIGTLPAVISTSNLSGIINFPTGFSGYYNHAYFFGDSCVSGQGSQYPNILDKSFTNAGYAFQVGNALRAGISPSLSVTNYAIAGATSLAHQWEEIWSGSLQTFPSGSIMFYAGTGNDINFFNNGVGPFDTNVGIAVSQIQTANMAWLCFTTAEAHPTAVDTIAANNHYGFTNAGGHWTNTFAIGNPWTPLMGGNPLLSTNQGDTMTFTNIVGSSAIVSFDKWISNSIGGNLSIFTNGTLYSNILCQTTNISMRGTLGWSNVGVGIVITNLNAGANTIVLSNAGGGWIAVNYCLAPHMRTLPNQVQFLNLYVQPNYTDVPSVTNYNNYSFGAVQNLINGGLNVNYIDCYSLMNSNLLAYDLVHPNYFGHIMLTQIILRSMTGSYALGNSYLASGAVINPAPSYIGGPPTITAISPNVKTLSTNMPNIAGNKFSFTFNYTGPISTLAPTNLFQVTYAHANANTVLPVISIEGTNAPGVVWNNGGYAPINETGAGFILSQNVQSGVVSNSASTNIGIIVDCSP